MRRTSLAALLLPGAFALGACTLGPNFSSPDAPRTDRYLAEDQPNQLVAAGIPGGEAQQIVQGLDIPGQWWGVFQSRPLNSLIERRARRQSRHPGRRRRGCESPSSTPARSAPRCFPRCRRASAPRRTRRRMCCRADPGRTATTIYGLFTAGLTISYTLDLFGANRRAVESLEALAEAQCFQLEAAYLSLASNVVAAAIQEASLRAQIEATKRIIAAQRETLGILRRQAGLGAITGADVATQEAALAQAEATLPPLQKALAQQRNLLATLTGRLPSDRVAERFELTDLKLPQELPLSLPSRLVEQRPDVRAAEANLHSASAAGRRRHRQPVPADHAQRRHQHHSRSPSASCSGPA